jgi:hypothetical protein
MKLKGWLRLWIVFSACWLSLIGYFAYEDFSALYGKKKFEVSKEGVGKLTFVFSASQSASEIQDYIKNQLVLVFEKEPQNYLGKVVPTPYEAHIAEYRLVKSLCYTKIALLPIFGLLALGWSFAWVKRGFARKTDA